SAAPAGSCHRRRVDFLADGDAIRHTSHLVVARMVPGARARQSAVSPQRALPRARRSARPRTDATRASRRALAFLLVPMLLLLLVSGIRNDEARRSNDEGNPNDETRRSVTHAGNAFVIRHLLFILRPCARWFSTDSESPCNCAMCPSQGQAGDNWLWGSAPARFAALIFTSSMANCSIRNSR